MLRKEGAQLVHNEPLLSPYPSPHLSHSSSVSNGSQWLSNEWEGLTAPHAGPALSFPGRRKEASRELDELDCTIPEDHCHNQPPDLRWQHLSAFLQRATPSAQMVAHILGWNLLKWMFLVDVGRWAVPRAVLISRTRLPVTCEESRALRQMA